MLSIESYDVDVCKATPEEQEAWAKLMSEHYSNEKDQFPLEFFLEYIKEESESILFYEKEGTKWMEEVFEGERGDRLNNGTTEEMSEFDKKMHEYFSRLLRCDPYAIIKSRERIKRVGEKCRDLEKELMEL